jgi:hypothetical protein
VRATRRLLPYALAEKRRSEVLVAIEVEPVDEGEADFSAVHLSGGDRCEPQELLKALFRTRTGDPLSMKKGRASSWLVVASSS